MMDYNQAIARIYDHLDNDNVEAATMACLRVARASGDHLNAATFLRELYPEKEEVARAMYDDANHLEGDALKFIWEYSFDRWLEVHTMDFAISSDEYGEDRKVLRVSVGDIAQELSQWKLAMDHLTPPTGLDPYDVAAFHDSANRKRAEIRLRMMALTTIKSRLKTRCLNFAIQVEKQVKSQDANQSFLWSVQNDVNNYFKTKENSVYEKLQKASALASSSNSEDAALVLTEVRRALKAAADHFFPPVDGLVMCSDGKERYLNDDRYLNRLNEYLGTKVASSTARELAQAELALIDTFMRRLNDLASKGVHADVSQAEARQGLVGMFMFLSTLIQTGITVPRATTPKF